MAGGGQGKMPTSRGGRGRLIRPGDLAVETRRKLRQRQSSEQDSEPIAPSVLPSLSVVSPPPSEPTIDVVTMIPTPGYIPSGQFECGAASHSMPHEPMLQQPPYEEVNRHEEQEEGEKEHEGDNPRRQRRPRQHQMDANRKIIIRPVGKGWTPAEAAADAIKDGITSQFLGAHYCWTVTPEAVRDFWWARFRDKVSWDPCHHNTIYKIFEQKCGKRLSDILGKKRKKGIKPKWMGDEAWNGLLAYWQSDAFKKISTQNKTNRASEKGGAVHTTGCRAHLKVALDMAQTSQGLVDPAEFFRATHQRTSSEWVDSRSQRTYEEYHRRLSDLQAQVSDTSTDGMHEVDGMSKL